MPDLVVIDQLNQQHHQQQQQQYHNIRSSPHDNTATYAKSQSINTNNQPEAASLITAQDLTTNDSQSQITFECLISFDRKKDRNLIIKWHHDDRIEPIFQWIPELNKRSIAPQYRAYIIPNTSNQQTSRESSVPLNSTMASGSGALTNTNTGSSTNSNQIQLLEAGFKLVRPTKELGGKFYFTHKLDNAMSLGTS